MKWRLSLDVAARRHFVDGREFFVLARPGEVDAARVGRREWALLAAADGTRDIEGVVRLAARKGYRLSEAEVAAWFDELARAGLLVDGAYEARLVPAPSDRRQTALVPSVRVTALPGFRMSCDGRGSCCRMYPTTVFDGVEMARACAFVPDVFDGGADVSRAFTPVWGGDGLSNDAAGRSWAGGAVGMRDGACGYLDEGRCRIHAAGGAGAKPAGCRLYPASFCHDGESVRVAPRPECACVFRSARRGDAPGGEALVSARDSAELEPAVFVLPLPEVVEVAEGSGVSRDVYLAWHRRVSGRVETTSAADVARRLVTLADELRGTASCANLLDELAPELDDLREHVRRRAALHGAWRAPSDLVRLVPSWIRDALDLLQHHGDGTPMELDERFYFDALAYGHLWLDEATPLAESLRQRAVRVLVARWLPTVLAKGPYAEDPALEHPLALVEAYGRSS